MAQKITAKSKATGRTREFSSLTFSLLPKDGEWEQVKTEAPKAVTPPKPKTNGKA